MTSAVQASNGKFYTGKAGEGWLASASCKAFTYSQEGAEAKAATFNKYNGPLCGLTFKAVTLNGVGEWK